jgi:site-specific recombinase XerD
VTSSGTPINLSTELIRYGGNLSTEERGQELLRVFGFNHLILKESLSFSSLRLYCRDFFAYWQFAGSREAALQPETLARWISSLSERRYSESTINRMVAIVQHIMRDAGSKGYIDLSVSAALQTIEKIPTPHQKSRADRKEMLYP